MAFSDMATKLMMGQSQPQAPQRGVGDVLSNLMMADQVYQTQAPVITPEQYEAVMAKVRKGQPRTDAETQLLQQYNIQRQTGGGWGTPSPRPGSGRGGSPTPTHKKESGLPRALTNPFSLIADAMKPR